VGKSMTGNRRKTKEEKGEEILNTQMFIPDIICLIWATFDMICVQNSTAQKQEMFILKSS